MREDLSTMIWKPRCPQTTTRRQVRYCLRSLRMLRVAGDALGNRVALGLKLFKVRRAPGVVQAALAFNEKLADRCELLGLLG